MSSQLTSKASSMKTIVSGGLNPKFNHGRKLLKSAQAFKKEFADLDSTIYAESMDTDKKNY